jgi:molecular chaperone GrpE
MDINFFKKKMKKNEEITDEQPIEATDNSTEETINTETNQPSEEHALPDAQVEIDDPIAKLEGELAESKDRLLRLLSEFDNFKKRTSRERIEMAKMAGADILLSILPVIDDFERALKAFGDLPENSAARDGVLLIYNKLKGIAESKGLKEMGAVGTIFNADLHDAITNVPAPSEEMKGKVVDEIEKGYYLHDKVIRHAKVIVGN